VANNGSANVSLLSGNGNRHYSPSGVFGDPTLATWQKGERITDGDSGRHPEGHRRSRRGGVS
jgi:hypothetical protein